MNKKSKYDIYLGMKQHYSDFEKLGMCNIIIIIIIFIRLANI